MQLHNIWVSIITAVITVIIISRDILVTKETGHELYYWVSIPGTVRNLFPRHHIRIGFWGSSSLLLNEYRE
jgi:hypothetical protein